MVEAIGVGSVLAGAVLIALRSRVARWMLSDYEVRDWRRIEALFAVMGALIVAAGLLLLFVRATA